METRETRIGIANIRQAFLSRLNMDWDVQVISGIALHVDTRRLKSVVGPVRGTALKRLPQLMKEAESLAQPKILYKVSVVRRIDGDALDIGGVDFRSALLARLLKEGQRVYPFVLTIGELLEQRAASTEPLWNHLLLDAMGTLLVSSLSCHLETVLKEEFGLTRFSRFSPGSLEAWPLTEQRPLFNLLGDVEEQIGVKLNDKLFMIPRKSLSGIYAATDQMYLSCRLCSKTPCPGRMARFSPALHHQYGLG